MIQDVSYFSSPAVLTPSLLFRERKGRGGGSVPVIQDDEQAQRYSKRVLLCKVCRNHITDTDQRTVIDSTHRHTFFNPSGVVFTIGCFRSASGCTHVGGPSSEFSWFAGTVWTPAACSGCLTHMGWMFEGMERRFWGLIMDKLFEAGS